MGGGGENCPSPLLDLARSKSWRTYRLPPTCKAAVICAGSPRAGSTAQCKIAEHILEELVKPRNSRGGLITHSHISVVELGYHNLLLHLFSGRGVVDTLTEGPFNNIDEWRRAEESLVKDDGDVNQSELRGGFASMKSRAARVERLGENAVIITKSHEFDAHLSTVCSKRVVLTASRNKEEVFVSASNLGWFDKAAAPTPAFEKSFTLWEGWKRCWVRAARDAPTTLAHHTSFGALAQEPSFREEVRKLAHTLARLIGVDPDSVNFQKVVNHVVSRDFSVDLNPMMSTGDSI